jgi:hypothetical protein
MKLFFSHSLLERPVVFRLSISITATSLIITLRLVQGYSKFILHTIGISIRQQDQRK